MRDPVRKMYKDARHRAAKKDIQFDIDVEDIVIPEICPILGIPLAVGTIHSGPESPSLDRIDNGKGYVKGNVWVISHLANTMKSNATFEQLHAFADWIKSEIPLDTTD